MVLLPKIMPAIYAERYPFPPMREGSAYDNTAAPITKAESNPASANLNLRKIRAESIPKAIPNAAP